MFERIYQGAVIEALKYSPLYEEGMSDDEILAAHGILSYSQTLEWKGAVEYCLTDQNGIASEEKIDTSSNYYGTVINAQTLEHAIPTLRNGVEKIIVIENKANYESMEYDPKVLYIFCHGYFSPKEVRFLQMLMKTAPEEIQYYHWGDMDYGGIQIFLYNEKNIFPNLMPWKMDAPSYKAALENGKGIKLSSGKQKKLEAVNAGKLEAAVLAVALACRQVHDLLVNFHFAGNQKAFTVGVLPGFDLILRHVLVVAVEGIDGDSDQCVGTQQSQHLMRKYAQTSEINSSQCSQNTYQQCHHMILFRLLRTFIIQLNNMIDAVYIH